jgi:hypothetical protein
VERYVQEAPLAASSTLASLVTKSLCELDHVDIDPEASDSDSCSWS